MEDREEEEQEGKGERARTPTSIGRSWRIDWL